MPDPIVPDPRAHEGFARAVDVLHAAASPQGFLASSTDRDNYRRVWARDGCVTALAALLLGDAELIATARATLETLAAGQGPHGEIPSYVHPESGAATHGGTVGRVDSDLWFVLACAEYVRRTDDGAFLERMRPVLDRVRFLLGAWEFNDRGLLYVPPSGDWADEYVQSGYVLYDQVLYLEAQKQFAALYHRRHGAHDPALQERIARLEDLICANYWFLDDDQDSPAIYHEVLYEQGRKAAPRRSGRYWMPYFTPFGYGYRFDAFANTLLGLLGVSTEARLREVDAFIDREFREAGRARILPAFWPVITPLDEKWDELQTTFCYEFKNNPYEYHNGGRWPMVSGFYAASLARRGHHDRAWEYLQAVHAGNALPRDGAPWSFSEYLHGRTGAPGGTHPMAWNAATAVIATCYLEGARLFGDRDDAACRG